MCRQRWTTLLLPCTDTTGLGPFRLGVTGALGRPPYSAVGTGTHSGSAGKGAERMCTGEDGKEHEGDQDASSMRWNGLCVW